MAFDPDFVLMPPRQLYPALISLSPDTGLAHSTVACHLLGVPNCSLKFNVSEASFWTPKPASKQPQVLLLHLPQPPSALLLK